MVLNGDLLLFPSTLNFLWFKWTVQTLIRRRVLIWFCTVCQCPKCLSQGFTKKKKKKKKTLWHHSDSNSEAMNSRYLDFVLRAVWQPPKEILAFVHCGLIFFIIIFCKKITTTKNCLVSGKSMLGDTDQKLRSDPRLYCCSVYLK